VSETFKILAPLDGWCDGLEAAPDAVFAGRLMGEGLTIDPTSSDVLAPCAGTIVGVPTTLHAVTLRTDAGIELLVHVGIDTVKLAGAGFSAHVTAGERVAAGQRMLSLDLDLLARRAKSLVTPVVVAEAAGATLARSRARGPVRAGEVLLELALPAAARSAPAGDPAGAAREARLEVALVHGLHARPAALLAQSLKGLDAAVVLEFGGRSANARSAVAIMALGVRRGDALLARAQGPAAEAALAALAQALAAALKHEGQSPAARPAEPSAAAAAPAAAEPGVASGRVAVPGFAVGRAARLERPEIEVREAGQGAAHERAELDRARALVAARLRRLADVGGGARREIVAAHLEFLEDPVLEAVAWREIDAGKSAGFAWRSAVAASVEALGALQDARLRERIDDLRDIEAHVLLALRGEARPMNVRLPERAVLLADELLPSELVALERDRLEAICLAGGGATSHVAILAAAMDVPMLIGLGPQLAGIATGAPLVVDAERGRLELNPSPASLAAAEARAAERRAARAAAQAAAQQACHSADGTRIDVFANVGSTEDAISAVANGAEGCGLLRTEFLFLERTEPPDEAEQRHAYQSVADALGGRPLVLRLLDVGGDKPLSYLPLPAEDNPALGLRGIRTGLARPDLQLTQLRAALAVAPARVLKLLVPMVTEVSELRAVRALIARALPPGGRRERVELGAMIETPAAAVTAAVLAREVDFLSIGSNDLSQYTLAMDRGHADLAGRIDALHPAVLRLIGLAAEGGAGARIPVAVCGGMAGDPLAVPLLLGLGVTELSMVPARIPATKALVKRLTLAECRELAAGVLGLDSAEAVRARVRAWLESRAIPPGGG